jgi:hypothetical protein
MISFVLGGLEGIRLTGKCQPYPHQDTELQEKDVEQEVSVVVVRNAIVHPRTVTVDISSCYHSLQEYLLITLRHAPLAPLAVLTTQRFPHHAIYTKVLLIKLP